MTYNVVRYGQSAETGQIAQRAFADVSGIAYLTPIFSFLLLFSVVFAILLKTKLLGEHKLGIAFISFLISSIFVSFRNGVQYVLTIIPWMSILLIALVFVFILLGLIGKDMDFMNKKIGVAVLIVAVVLFLVSAFFVFSETIGQYVPYTRNYQPNIFSDFVFSPRVVGAIVLLIFAGLTSLVLVKANGKE